MTNLEKRKLAQICWLLHSYRFDLSEQHLCNLLYLCNKEQILHNGRFMFMCKMYAVPGGFSYEEEAMQIIKESIFRRDFIEYYFRLGYYLLGYLDFFSSSKGSQF